MKKTEKETDVIMNDKTDTVVEAKHETAVKAKSLIIKLEDLVPFRDHPYKVIENESMTELTDSIKEHGILSPLLVRPLEGEDGKYEIISGHRRFFAAQKLGLKKVPCTVHFIDRDAATVMMVDSNCQRTELLPSEKAKAYKMKMDAMSRQGKRTDLEQTENVDSTSRPLGAKSRDNRTDEKLAENSNDSARQISRYIRLTYLVPELLQYVDDGKIGMRPAVEMSYLDEEVQRDIVDRIDESGGEVFPSHAQTRRIREKAAEGEISYEDVKAIMDEQKPNQIEKVKIPADELRKRIGKNMTDEDFIKYLYSAVDYYKKYLERNRDQGAR
ncbi:MAG: ParB/RepB/Spo0J family partition protein [Clostridia bacterium]|nr:ParB/RepB/Spo0J family partition protein [Clostridia bacterium]